MGPELPGKSLLLADLRSAPPRWNRSLRDLSLPNRRFLPMTDCMTRAFFRFFARIQHRDQEVAQRFVQGAYSLLVLVNLVGKHANLSQKVGFVGQKHVMGGPLDLHDPRVGDALLQR